MRRTRIDKGNTQGGKLVCRRCGTKTPFRQFAYAARPPDRRLFALEAESPQGREFKMADDSDLSAYLSSCAAYDATCAGLPIPSESIPTKGRSDPRPISHGHHTYASLFNKRQLVCLGEIAVAIMREGDSRLRSALAVAFSDSLAANNMLCAYAFGYRRLTPLFGLHAYRRVMRPVENNVWGAGYGRGSFAKCFWKLVRAKRYAREPYEFKYSKGKPRRILTGEKAKAAICQTYPDFASRTEKSLLILNQSSEGMGVIPRGTVDLILTDPPYFNNLAYSELSDFFHVWLRRLLGNDYVGKGLEHTPMGESLFPRRRSTASRDDATREFRSRMKGVFAECRRVISKQGLLVLTHHHRTLEAWKCLGTALLTNRFLITNVVPVRSEGKSGFHSSEGNIKWDAVICARPASGLKRGTKYPGPARDRARASLRQWRTRLRKRQIELSQADANSFARALLLGELSGVAWSERRLLEAIESGDPVPS